jgi:hypothetical protein
MELDLALRKFIGKLVESFDVYISKDLEEIIAETEDYEDIHDSYIKELVELAKDAGFEMESLIPDEDTDILPLRFIPRMSMLEEQKEREREYEQVKTKIQTSLPIEIEQQKLIEDENRKEIEKIREQEKELIELINEICEGRRWLRNNFHSKFGIKFLRESESSIMDLMGICENKNDFTIRILTLAYLIDDIDYKEIKEKFELSIELIKKQGLVGSINILEFILQNHFPNYDRKIIKNLRDIRKLRKKYPIHPDTPEFVGTLKDWKFSTPPTDWNAVWSLALKKYLESIRVLNRLFS